MDMSLSKLQEMVKDMEAWHTAVHVVAELDMTDQLNKNWFSALKFCFVDNKVKAQISAHQMRIFMIQLYLQDLFDTCCNIKKAEHQRIDAFELCCWRKLSRVPWTARRLASLTQWTWVWANSGRQWRTGKPVLLQPMGVTKSWAQLSNWTTTTLQQCHSF